MKRGMEPFLVLNKNNKVYKVYLKFGVSKTSYFIFYTLTILIFENNRIFLCLIIDFVFRSLVQESTFQYFFPPHSSCFCVCVCVCLC